ncbi:MAG: aldo/keto reductase, partial [Halobacteria archaeon]|nr:aldo/keto reductase [Halobacteria archaeon]
LRDIGEKYAKSPAQISLRWLTQQENVVAIPKSSSPEHQRQNVDIFDFELDDEEMRRIARPSRLRTLYRLARSRLPI